MKRILKLTRYLHKKAKNLHIATLRHAIRTRDDYADHVWAGAQVARQMADTAMDRALQTQAQTDNSNKAARLEIDQLGVIPE